MQELLKIYSGVRDTIESRLDEFREVWDSGTDDDVFRELVFCLFTPQSKAASCWAAVERVQACDLLVNGTAEEISGNMSGVRFHHTKARRVVKARGFRHGLKARISSFDTAFQAREWLVENIDGMSYKEASHFLRNIGMGSQLAILDRHILRNLEGFGVISRMPKSLTPAKYKEIEGRMADFSMRIGIPMDHLDMLLWYKEAGEVFK